MVSRRNYRIMATYYGNVCLTDCSGHKEGARYVRSGGRSLTRSSPSFNTGMRTAQGQLKKKGTRSRLSITKKSK
jgi:hypothetical protein